MADEVDQQVNIRNTVNSFCSCGPRRDLELVSSVGRVRNSRSLFQSNICNIFFLGLKKSCPCYRGVCYSRASTRRELTVWLCLHKCSLLTSDRKLKSFIKISLTLSLRSGPVCSLLNSLQCSFEICGNSISLLSP